VIRAAATTVAVRAGSARALGAARVFAALRSLDDAPERDAMISAGPVHDRDVRAQGGSCPCKAVMIDDDIVGRMTFQILPGVHDAFELARLATASTATDPSPFPGERALGDRSEPIVRYARNIGGWSRHRSVCRAVARLPYLHAGSALDVVANLRGGLRL
jgi:hypothetical protein